jgi:hypothetical protein
MPTPVLITPNDDFFVAGTPGPFQIGSKIYVISQDMITAVINCWMSSDSGNTWSKIDGAHSPAATTRGFAACTDGTNIWVAFNNVADTALMYAGFDTVTGFWLSSVSTGVVGSGPQQIAYRPSDTSLIICGFASGTFLLSYVVATIGGGTIGWTTCSNNAAGKTTNCWAILQGAGTDLWFVFTEYTTAGIGTQHLQTQKVGSGSVTNIDTGASNSGISNAPAAGYSDGTTIAIVWAPNAGVDSANVLQAPAATMIFVSSTLVPPGGTSQLSFFVTFVSGSTTVVVFNLASPATVLYFFVNTGGGYGAAVFLADTGDVTEMYINAIALSSSGWSMTYDDDSGIEYLASGAAPPSVSGVVNLPGIFGVHTLPSSHTQCNFARKMKCGSRYFRQMISGKEITYGVVKRSL